jgi:pimeloyl-ACP methyl ester carboxylesterase
MESLGVHVAETKLDELRTHLLRTRLEPALGEDWAYGTPGGYLRDLVNYWIDGYSWREQEERLNEFPQFRCQIDGVNIHTIVAKGKGPAPLPLVLTHGWPWSLWDYAKLIGPLTDPESYGADARDSFDVVVPALPGHQFSGQYATGNMSCWLVARLWHRLMTETLGFDRYGAHGGDWGGVVSAYLAHLAYPELLGVHLSSPVVLDDQHPVGAVYAPESDYAATESDWRATTKERVRWASAHVAAHTTSAASLGQALADSPAGLLSWMVERRQRMSDCEGDIESCYTKSELITTAAAYWLSDTVGSSLRFYADHYRQPFPRTRSDHPAARVPTAVAVFPKDTIRLPRRFVAGQLNLQQWTVMPRGGHFAPSEQPALLAKDLRRFFRHLR